MHKLKEAKICAVCILQMYKTLLSTHICVHMYIEELFLYFQLKVSDEGLADSQKTSFNSKL